MDRTKPISWFGRWSKRQIADFKNWLQRKWEEGKAKDSDFKMDAKKLSGEYPPFLSKIRSYVPGLDEVAKTEYFMKTRTIPLLKKLGFEGVRGLRYWRQESFEDIELLIRDNEKRMKGTKFNLIKLIEKQAKLGTITEVEKKKLLAIVEEMS